MFIYSFTNSVTKSDLSNTQNLFLVLLPKACQRLPMTYKIKPKSLRLVFHTLQLSVLSPPLSSPSVLPWMTSFLGFGVLFHASVLPYSAISFPWLFTCQTVQFFLSSRLSSSEKLLLICLLSQTQFITASFVLSLYLAHQLAMASSTTSLDCKLLQWTSIFIFGIWILAQYLA